MTSFKKLMERQSEMIARLTAYSGLDKDLVENIVQYGKHLVQPGTNDITDNTFVSQMMCWFQITNQMLVNQMFEVLMRPKKVLGGKDIQVHALTVKQRIISLEDYCKCVCTFLTNNMNLKIDWVFSVYDANDDGVINKLELYMLLKPCVLHSEEMDTEEAIKDLIDIVLAVVDKDKSGSVDIEEFRILVRRNVLYIDLLGQCLPREQVVKRFLKKIENKSPMEVSSMFQKELENGLVIPSVTAENKLYPIHLDLP